MKEPAVRALRPLLGGPTRRGRAATAGDLSEAGATVKALAGSEPLLNALATLLAAVAKGKGQGQKGARARAAGAKAAAGRATARAVPSPSTLPRGVGTAETPIIGASSAPR